MLRNCLIIVAAWLALGTVMAADDPGQVLVANTAADGPAALAKPAVESTEEERIKQDEEKRRFFSYSRKGLQISEEGKGRFSAKVNIRSQIRFSSPFQSAPRDEGDFSAIEEGDLRFRRARFKMEGHAFTPWVKYKYEHDLVGTRVLDARMTIGKWEWLQFRFGQWKVDYSRERMDSSGKQQFADRSIVNRAFTLDRQKGATVLGHLMKGTRGDSRYYVGVFAGNGRGFWTAPDKPELDHGDGSPMLMARYQWNFLGRDVGHSQSDLEYSEEPAAALSFGAARNRSRYTRFSSSGGEQLDGFELGQLGQYSLRQFMEEATLKYRGLSLQHELHWKTIEDNVNMTTTDMIGSYVQAGYFFHYLVPRIPKQLEFGARYAMVDPNRIAQNDLQKELAFVVNWYFYGHGNKLTFDTTRFSLGRTGAEDLRDTQVRIQWDVSF
jgi:phosphate-selective porin OprO/OprP